MLNNNYNTNLNCHNSPNSVHKRPVRLRNVITKNETFDSLHIKPCEVSSFIKFYSFSNKYRLINKINKFYNNLYCLLPKLPFGFSL